MADSHRYRLVLDMSADDLLDLAAKLNDIAYDLQVGHPSPKSVFASPSCSGVVEVTHIGGTP